MTCLRWRSGAGAAGYGEVRTDQRGGAASGDGAALGLLVRDRSSMRRGHCHHGGRD